MKVRLRFWVIGGLVSLGATVLVLMRALRSEQKHMPVVTHPPLPEVEPLVVSDTPLAPSVSLPTRWSGRPILLLVSVLVCLFLGIQSLLNQYTLGVILWGGLALIQMLVAIRTPGFGYEHLVPSVQHIIARNPARFRFILMVWGTLSVAGTFAFAWSEQFSGSLLFCWAGAGVCWSLLTYNGRWQLPGIPRITLNRQTAAFVILMIGGGAALFYNLDDLPHEMISDHAEYATDAVRVQDGVRDIYFESNSGREPLFIYLVVLVSQSIGGVSYLSLKLVSASAAFLMLPALYLLGRQINGRLTGLFTLGIGAVSTWTVVTGRIGFRVMFAGLAMAWLLVMLIQALRSGRRRDFLLAGMVLGAGQYGYSSFRIAPLIVAAWALLGWWVTPRGERRKFVQNVAVLGGIAFIIFIPLLSYWIHSPAIFWGRTDDLVGQVGSSIIGEVIQDLVKTLLMFNLGGDQVDLNLPYHNAPVLSPLIGALFLLGLLVCIWRSLHKADWKSWFLLAAFLVGILPSALATGTPGETPSARRAITALPVVMLFAGWGLALIVRWIYQQRAWFSHGLAYSVGIIAIVGIATFDLTTYFQQFPANYYPPAQREIAGAINQFVDQGGDLSNVYIVYGTHNGWLDPRSVSIWMGRPHWDHVIISVDPVQCLPYEGQALMVVMQSDDLETLKHLKTCFPQGKKVEYQYQQQGFWVYYMPGE